MKNEVILLGEDEEDDVLLFHKTLSRVAPEARIVRLEDGDQVLKYLQGRGKYADRAAFPVPDLIFLDGQLHHQPSFGLLLWIVNHPGLDQVPVSVLTGSLDPTVALEAKGIGAVECFEKPFTAQNWEHLQEMIQAKRFLGKSQTNGAE